MRTKRFNFPKLRRIQVLVPALIVGVLILTGAVIYNFNAHAATAGFYFSSSASSYKVGTTFNVAVYENSGTACANVAQADFTYPSNLLRFNSISASGSKFESTAPSNSGSGSVSIIQYTSRKECGSSTSPTSGVSGNQLIANVSFTAIASGTATLNFKNSTIAVSSADNRTNVAPGMTGKSFSLTAAPTPPPPTPTPTPPSPTPPSPTPGPVQPSPTPSSITLKPVTSYTPSDTDSSVPVGNYDVVQLDTPADIHPLPIQPDGINRIEYYLDGKLVATVKTAPYNYHLDTTKLLNGQYTFTTKTYYSNGQSKSVSQTLIVKNPFGWSQFRLWLQHYVWVVILLLLALAAVVGTWIVHRRNDGGSDDYYDDSDYSDSLNTGYTPTDGPLVSPTQAVAPEADAGAGGTSQGYWADLAKSQSRAASSVAPRPPVPAGAFGTPVNTPATPAAPAPSATPAPQAPAPTPSQSQPMPPQGNAYQAPQSVTPVSEAPQPVAQPEQLKQSAQSTQPSDIIRPTQPPPTS